MFSSLVTAIGIDYICKYICTASIMTTSHQQHQVQLPRKEVVYLSLSWIAVNTIHSLRFYQATSIALG